MSMFRKILSLILMTGILVSCATAPISGRKQMMLVSNHEILTASKVQYHDFIRTAPKSLNVNGKQQVYRVGRKIAAATEAYLKMTGLEKEIRNFSWEFNLVRDSQLNAFCMPGGKIVVYEGLLELIQSDDELAVVLGHEVAHAVAKHSNERMSQQLIAQMGSQLINMSLDNKSAAVRTIVGEAYGMGAQLGIMLPFSRKHELEADHIGVILMRLAGYDVDASLKFWKKMAAAGKGKVPEMLSTHPSDRRRIDQLSAKLPEIKKKYQPIQ